MAKALNNTREGRSTDDVLLAKVLAHADAAVMRPVELCKVMGKGIMLVAALQEEPIVLSNAVKAAEIELLVATALH